MTTNPQKYIDNFKAFIDGQLQHYEKVRTSQNFVPGTNEDTISTLEEILLPVFKNPKQMSGLETIAAKQATVMK